MKEFCDVVLTFESVDEILWCDQFNESYWAVIPFVRLSMFCNGVKTKELWISVHCKMEASEKYFPLALFKLRHKYCSIIGL